MRLIFPSISLQLYTVPNYCSSLSKKIKISRNSGDGGRSAVTGVLAMGVNLFISCTTRQFKKNFL